MRKYLLAATVVAVLSAPAFAAANGPYVGVEGGATFPQSTDLDVILNKLEEMSNNARTSANKLSAQDQSSGASVRRVSGGGVTAGLT